MCANFNTTGFINHDDYMTPKHAWEDIQNLIPRKVIWEAFYGNGESGKYLSDLGFETIHQEIDFFQNDCGEIIVSNPPFSQTKEVLTRLKALGKPFIMILPSSKINTQYFRELYSKDTENPIQIIVPKKRIQFEKLVNGERPSNYKSACSFDCFYYCWKIELTRDIIWLD